MLITNSKSLNKEYCLVLQVRGFQCVVPRPETKASPGNILKRQILKPFPIPIQSETLKVVSTNLCFNIPSDVSNAHSSLRVNAQRKSSASCCSRQAPPLENKVWLEHSDTHSFHIFNDCFCTTMAELSSRHRDLWLEI